MYTFVSQYGSLTIQRVDMDGVYEAVEEYRKQFPPPNPPMKPPPWDLSLARKANALVDQGYQRKAAKERVLSEAPLVEDKGDADYIRAMRLYHILAYHVMEKAMLERGVVGKSDVLNRIISDEAERLRLFHFIRDHSELTETVVIRAVDRLGFTWKAAPVYEAKNALPAGHSGGTWAAWGKVAATQSGISPLEFKEMDVSDQAELLACWMCANWMESLAIKDSQEKVDAKRLAAKVQNRGGR